MLIVRSVLLAVVVEAPRGGNACGAVPNMRRTRGEFQICVPDDGDGGRIQCRSRRMDGGRGRGARIRTLGRGGPGGARICSSCREWPEGARVGISSRRDLGSARICSRSRGSPPERPGGEPAIPAAHGLPQIHGEEITKTIGFDKQKIRHFMLGDASLRSAVRSVPLDRQPPARRRMANPWPHRPVVAARAAPSTRVAGRRSEVDCRILDRCERQGSRRGSINETIRHRDGPTLGSVDVTTCRSSNLHAVVIDAHAYVVVHVEHSRRSHGSRSAIAAFGHLKICVRGRAAFLASPSFER